MLWKNNRHARSGVLTVVGLQLDTTPRLYIIYELYARRRRHGENAMFGGRSINRWNSGRHSSTGRYLL